MHAMSDADPIVVMGVEGTGKSTVAQALSERLGYEYLDADWFHSLANRAKMASGEPLSDEDRWPWLRAVGERIRAESDRGRVTVTACSALKRSYRDLLREYEPAVFFVFLDGSIDEVRKRLERRHHPFMPSSLLDSQFAVLEPLAPDERGVRIDIQLSRNEQVDEIARALSS
jgi:carbohydrate kinase (thermoresistant glucokinase family)